MGFIEDYDICTITETKIDALVTDEAILPTGYWLNRCDRNSQGGGVVTFIRGIHQPKVINSIQDKYSELGMEITVSRLSISNEPTIILGIYRPPNTRAHWMGCMQDMILEILPYGKLIIMGDMNCDLLKTSSYLTQSLRKSLKMANSGIDAVVLKATRVTPTSATCIDFISVDRSFVVSNYQTHTLLVSDHLPVVASISTATKPPLVPILRRSYKNVDLVKLETRVANINIDICMEADNLPLDETISKWNKEFVNILNEEVPLKQFPRKKCVKPWINQKTKGLMRYRTSLARNLKKNPFSKTIHDNIKNIKRRIKSRIRANLKEHGQALLTNNSMKDAWKFVKKVTLTGSKSSNNAPDLFKQNDFFANLVTTDKPKLADSVTTELADTELSYAGFDLLPITQEKTLKLLRRVKTDTATGPDDVPAFIIHKLAHVLAPTITEFFNKSIASSSFPAAWKMANVCAVYKKKGAKDEVDNYRPISVLPVLGRLLEKAVSSQLQCYCDAEAIIPPQQFGFRRKSSCELALVAAQDKWMAEVASGAYVGALLIDLSKAFDSVEHSLLIDELRKIGCSSRSLKWFTSYLSDRQQRVKSGSVITPWKQVSKGVPQGSALSPLLFNIFVRELPKASGTDCFQFADDIVVILKNRPSENRPCCKMCCL